MAGGQHHHRINMDKYHPGYFGKVGMRYFHLNKNKFWRPTINVNKLWTLVGDEVREEFANKTEVAPVINTLRAGYGKVLGGGYLPAQPVIVKTREVSKRAEEKIKLVGGAVVLI
ncbi:hypothetical protein AMAG_10252 [Allomyces macrogynus ATCC 38327]|uniref:Large ribosomal subunit protein uL15/eL18 domain-containing protein n=1 Tax=Allomyces macrogynus (strain ATCC 38327) TaxID=578462 RepID=A0A0L0SUG7_ALLM3|nr:hypothetical protein AMAG_10252 [Allomyces macrogynus ATCC 38327]|eukprot:KNE65969.1 hypothetical protein AMAG_10252 [Allomyces macrogynus ATCC 38327]